MASTTSDTDGAFLFKPKTALDGVADQFYLEFEPRRRVGVQGGSETGVAGVVVHLRDGQGALLASTTTDAEGDYLFKPKIASRGVVDQFYLEFEAPDGMIFTDRDVGDDTLDSDVDLSSGETATYTPNGQQAASVAMGASGGTPTEILILGGYQILWFVWQLTNLTWRAQAMLVAPCIFVAMTVGVVAVTDGLQQSLQIVELRGLIGQDSTETRFRGPAGGKIVRGAREVGVRFAVGVSVDHDEALAMDAILARALGPERVQTRWEDDTTFDFQDFAMMSHRSEDDLRVDGDFSFESSTSGGFSVDSHLGDRLLTVENDLDAKITTPIAE